ncbi:thioester domain-containing protein [Romboutsia lituseburensis]|uniref:thioester domain-containing protein n=1 Tax=Romboutsia lituseburensis TaxID=1537 RepID=UPI00215A2691|nr:thioester domain-containing protein [Romboutsia lituseburensis]MCR8743724.1 thioester domain-containing protein [Romboutsia lituseburensis]
MKNLKKLISIIMVIAFFINPSLSRAMNTENKESEKLYLAYCENNDIGVSIRVVDGKGHDGKDNIVYCYDRNNKYPSISGGYEEHKTYYTRVDSYLNTNDPYADKYGKDKKERIASVLYQGYPNDNSGLIQKNRLSEYEAMKMTQYLIWDITENTDYELKPYDRINQRMANYYNDLLKLSKIDKF